MVPKITINIKRGKDLACAVSYEIDNGIRVINALSALESLVNQIKEKSVEHARKEGVSDNNTSEEIQGFFSNQMLEELF